MNPPAAAKRAGRNAEAGDSPCLPMDVVPLGYRRLAAFSLDIAGIVDGLGTVADATLELVEDSEFAKGRPGAAADRLELIVVQANRCILFSGIGRYDNTSD